MLAHAKRLSEGDNEKEEDISFILSVENTSKQGDKQEEKMGKKKEKEDDESKEDNVKEAKVSKIFE